MLAREMIRRDSPDDVARRQDAREAIARYVRHRLSEECREYGAQARIAREIGVSGAHLNNVRGGSRGVGEDLARALARFWGMSYADLEEVAVEWAEANPAETAPASAPRPRRLGEHAQWADAAAKAQEFTGLPPEYFELVSTLQGPVSPASITPAFVANLAKSFADLDADLRAKGQPGLLPEGPVGRSGVVPKTTPGTPHDAKRKK